MANTICINGEELPIEVNLWTLVEYESEFGADLLQDFFGKSVPRGNGEIGIDFANTEWTKLAKIAWACLKTANASIPQFRLWATSVKELPLLDIAPALAQPFVQAFFRYGDGSPSQKPKQEE